MPVARCDHRAKGLLDAAVARPPASAFGLDAYPDDVTKAAALLQSLARSPALVDGNKRTARAAAPPLRPKLRPVLTGD